MSLVIWDAIALIMTSLWWKINQGGPHFTHVFPITCQILWKIRFAVTPFLFLISLQLFAHATTTHLSCRKRSAHKNLDESNLEFSSHFNCDGKLFVNGPRYPKASKHNKAGIVGTYNFRNEVTILPSEFVLNSVLTLGMLRSAIFHHPWCFCPWTFFQNIAFNMVPSDPFMSHIVKLGYSTGEFQSLQLIVLVAFGVMD